MNIKPEYGEDIIVLIKFKGKYSWYLSEIDLWIMDYFKWQKVFSSSGVDGSFSVSERKAFPVVNEDNWEIFKDYIDNKVISKEQLSEIVLKNVTKEWNECSELFPSLYIDFDSKVLISLFPEYTTFEKYVPDGWIGKYDDFYGLIPDSEKYWLINGINYMPR